VVLELPHLARAAAAIGRRVHDDRIVAAPTLELAPHELQAVVGDVADRRLGQAAERGVLAAPLHHALGGVHMAHLGSRGGGRARGGAGVAEQIQDGNLPASRPGCLDLGAEPLPVHRLLGEKAGVLEAGGADLERQLQRLIPDRPVIRQLPPELPASTPRAAPVIESVPVLPLGPGRGALPRPDDLRVGSDQCVRAPALLFHAIAAIEQLVILPAVGDDQGGTLQRHEGNHGRCAPERNPKTHLGCIRWGQYPGTGATS